MAWQFLDAKHDTVIRTNADGSFQSMMASALSPDDLAAVLPETPPVPNDVIDNQIAALEAANPITHRALREFILGTLAEFKLDPSQNPATAKVAQVEAEILALRSQRK